MNNIASSKINKLIIKCMINRMMYTIIFYMILFCILATSVFSFSNIYIILPLGLTILDKVNNLTLGKNKDIITKTFTYQSNYKLIDSISYLSLFIFFDLDIVLFIFALYRFIGILYFLRNKQNKFLVYFPDFIKEYLLYKYFYADNYNYLCVFLVGKVVFEYYYNFHNKPRY